MNPVSTYYREIQATYASGAATELSYRSALQELLKALDAKIEVINEPRQTDFGAPDLVLQRDGLPIGYIECKDLHIDLDAAAKSEQLERYCKACDNLILTNYLEFRWFRGEEWQDTQSFAELREGELRNIYYRNSKLRLLLEQFLRATPQDIHSPEELAQVMATLTSEIAAQIRAILDEPRRKTFLWKHKHDLEIELLPTLNNVEFADMYAQTIAYALFAARMELQHLPAAEFTLARAFTDMPRTNPFLHREFGQILQDLEGEVKWAVEQLTTRLAHTEIGDVMQDFRGKTEQRDAVVHFYEDFLATYDPVMREQRGVYFTPEPVVGYIVRSVDSLLRSHFGRRDGLASGDVHILDPATGTGSFLLAVVEQIYETMRGQRGIWADYVRRQLLPRLHGFELLMAPYTLAHMRLGLYLGETGYQLNEGDRLGIYLTNALDRGVKKEEFLWDDHIVTEANAAAEVKNNKPIMVVLGNPPYSGHSANKGDWIRDLLRDYHTVDGAPLGERQQKWLQDDYVKFLRFGQWRIEENGEGILAFITNHAWLDNPTFRGMRQSLLNSFSEIYVMDLHGNSKKKETSPDGNKDKNVFDIQQGVSISILVKHSNQAGPAHVFHMDLWGLRNDKYNWLDSHDVIDTDWQEIIPQSPFYFFTPFDYEGWREYERGWKITEIFPIYSTGMVTGRDKFVLDFDYDSLLERFEKMRDLSIPSDEIRHLVAGYELKDSAYFQLESGRKALNDESNIDQYIYRCLYRPFDSRLIFYHPSFITRQLLATMRHMCYGTAEPGISQSVDAERRSPSCRQSDSSPFGRWPKASSITHSSATPSSRAASHSATRGSDSSSRYISTRRSQSSDGDKSAAIPDWKLVSDRSNKHPDGILLYLQQDEGNQLPLPALSLPRESNLGMITTRTTKDEWGASCTNTICGHKSFSAFDINYLFPLYLYD